MKKVLLFLFVFLLLFQSKAFAESDYFSRGYDVSYQVKDDGITAVVLKVTLTNKTSDYYASSDTITVGFEDMQNLKATDGSTDLKAKVTKTDDGNSIELPFNQKTVGKDKSVSFIVSFDTKDIAKHKGETWEINIPGISNPEDFSNFKADVKVPDSFGSPSYIKPQQNDKALSFTKEELGKSGISIAYGSDQLYGLDLVYHLRNKNVFPIRTEIALPPTNNYQDIAIESIEPKPDNVITDVDGNWLAQYNLSPSERVDIKVKGKANVFLSPKATALTPEEKKLYLKEQKYWQTSSSKIKDLVKIYNTPEKIYQYVVTTLTYDFDRVSTNQPRLGAVQALQNPTSAVCLEFTDLFITLARAAGIPAREINGFANTENSKQRPLSLVQDILHSWPEYYDETRQTWVMVDPTWGNTTGGTDYFSVLDFDHITFITKGKSSEYPVPAGGYKFEGDEKKKDVNVSFTNSFPNLPEKASVQLDFPEKLLPIFSIAGTVTITNSSQTVFPSQIAVVESADLTPTKQEISLPEIPPFGHVNTQIGFNKTSLFSNKTYNFTFTLQDTIIQKSVLVTPFSFTRAQLIIFGGVFLAILTISLFIITRKTRRIPLPEQGKGNIVRGEGEKPQI